MEEKQMKKIVSMLQMAAMAALVCACSNSEDMSPAAQGSDKEVTLSASLPGADSRTTFTESSNTMKVNWAATDNIKILNGSQSNASSNFSNKDASTLTTAKFTGELAMNAGDRLYGIYPSSLSLTGTTATVDYSAQTASTTPSAIQNKAVMYASATYAASGTTLAFSNATSILKFSLSLPEAADIKTITLSTVDNSLINKEDMTVSASGITWANPVKGDITLTFDQPQSVAANGVLTCYALIIPQTLNGVIITASNADGSKTYREVFGSNNTLVATKMYRITKSLYIPPTIGSYLYSDGTWGTEKSPSGKSVIGVIFQNNPKRINNTMITAQDGTSRCSHGLAMALCDVHDNTTSNTNYYYSWYKSSSTTTSSFLSNDVNSLKSCFDNVKGWTYTWGSLNVMASSSYNAAFYVCSNFTGNVKEAVAPNICSKWFLPSTGQWVDVYNNLGKASPALSETACGWLMAMTVDASVLTNVNKAFTDVSASSYALALEKYWTSCEVTGNAACYIQPLSTSVLFTTSARENAFRVRPVIAF